jgi:rubredoxin
MTEGTTTRRWKSAACGVIYDPDKGYPEADISPGTPFEQIPDAWTCPVCGTSKSGFEPIVGD